MARVAEEKIGPGRSRIAENTVALTVAGALQMVFTLVQLGVLSRSLGGERFGLYVALRGFSLLLSTVILVGFPQVLIRFLPSFQNRDRRGSATGWFVFFSAIVALLGAVLFISTDRWSGLLPASLSVGEGLLRWMVLASMALAMKLLVYGGFSGLREMRMQMVFEVSFQVVFTAVIVAGREYLDVRILFAVITVVNTVVWAAAVPVYIATVRKSFTRPASSMTGEIVLPSPAGYWGSSLALSYVALAFTDVDRFVMSSLLPVAAISVYHVASRVNQLIKRFLGFPVVALQPELTRIYEEGRWGDLSERIGIFTKASVIASMAMASIAAATGGILIRLISGTGYSGAYVILLILLPTVPAAAFIAPLTAAMRALHYMRWAVVSDLAWMAVYFSGLFIIVPRIGLAGTAAAQLAASAVQAVIAVSLARREGLYAGAGAGAMLKALAVAAVFAAAGSAACAVWGIPAAAACIVLAPFILRFAARKLSLFDGSEAARLVEMLRGRPGTRLVRWILSLEVS